MRTIAVVLFSFMFSLSAFGQITNTKIVFLSGKNELVIGEKNYVRVVTKLEKEKITLGCDQCTLTKTDGEKVIFLIYPPKNAGGKKIKVEVSYPVNGKRETIYSQMVKVIAPKKKP